VLGLAGPAPPSLTPRARSRAPPPRATASLSPAFSLRSPMPLDHPMNLRFGGGPGCIERLFIETHFSLYNRYHRPPSLQLVPDLLCRILCPVSFLS